MLARFELAAPGSPRDGGNRRGWELDPPSVAGGRGEGERLAVARPQGPDHADLVRAAPVVQRRFNPMVVERPPATWDEGAGAHRAEFVGAADATLRRRLGVERDDGLPFGANSGSVRVAQARGGCQRAPSRKRMRRSWLRCTAMPRSRAAVSALSVQCASARSAATKLPSAGVSSRPGGAVVTKPTMMLRSASVSQGFRPGPERSPSPSRPSALNRSRRSRTVCGWHCS
jgi:hypothetical protein